MRTHEHGIAEGRIVPRDDCGDQPTDEEQDHKDRIAFQQVSDAGDEIIANRVKEMFPSKRR